MDTNTVADEGFLSAYQRYHPISLPESASDEEVDRDWTLSPSERDFLVQFNKRYRLVNAIQLCSMRLYGRFLANVSEVMPKIISHLSVQLGLPPTLSVTLPKRDATASEQRSAILVYLGFRRFDEAAKADLESWVAAQAQQGELPAALFACAEQHLLSRRIILPGPSTLERLVLSASATAQTAVFATICQTLSPTVRAAIDRVLEPPPDQQQSLFQQLKDTPPSASISCLQEYLRRYFSLEKLLQSIQTPEVSRQFVEYLCRLARRYTAQDMKRFKAPKRYALMVCFLFESRKTLLDHLVNLHDQYMTDVCRQARNAYEKQHRALRRRHKRALDTVLNSTRALLACPESEPLNMSAFWEQNDPVELQSSVDNLTVFKSLEERGYGDRLLARYSSMRKFFAAYLQLPFAAESGSAALLDAIKLVRRLDDGTLKQLPPDAPVDFVPRELRIALRTPTGALSRRAWEMGLAMAIKDALRAGNLFLAQSKHYVSFWDLVLPEDRWKDVRQTSYAEFHQPSPEHVRSQLSASFEHAKQIALARYDTDPYAEVVDGRLKLKRDKPLAYGLEDRLQKTIEASLPLIRIEKLLMEVDKQTGFTRHFVPLARHQSRPHDHYKTLLAVLISQATNLGVVSMGASVPGLTVDKLRHVLHHYVRDDTLKAASAALVNQHHQLPLSAVHGSGRVTSSDGQRFRIRADTLLGSYYPRYFGYYDKAVGIYTHVSDQYSVFGTQVISCGPREALYVLDGLLDNNTVLEPRIHTTDTDGYTECVFGLCHLLGYEFMPRIRGLSRQQLYRIDRDADNGVFAPLLSKTVNLELIVEQWDAMMRLARSLKERTAPAHVIVQRLTNTPADRLSKAITHLGRLLKTQYTLRYITDAGLRRVVQRQLNKGEYRQKLSRRIFFADQGEFTTGDYIEIMNKASCLSLVSNAILYWNTVKIGETVDSLRAHGEQVNDEDLSHISLLPFKHVLPNGAYFIDSALAQ